MAQRALTMLNQHRRPVLLGVAGIMTLLTGVAVLEMRGHGPLRKSEIETPATPLAKADPQSPPNALTATDMPPTGAIGDAPKVISAVAAAEGGDGAETESGPKPPSALIGALPAGFGGALAAALEWRPRRGGGDRPALLEGRTVARDPKAAAGWMQAAADAGSAFAQYRLGALYEKGVGVTRDLGRARELYKKAADAGNARAMHNLAVLYAQDGGAGKPDYAAALEWFRKAGGYGVRDSQFNLGVLYGRGLREQDLAESWMWFSLAAKQGDTDAAHKRDEVENRMDGRVMTAAKKLLAEFKTNTPAPAATILRPLRLPQPTRRQAASRRPSRGKAAHNVPARRPSSPAAAPSRGQYRPAPFGQADGRVAFARTQDLAPPRQDAAHSRRRLAAFRLEIERRHQPLALAGGFKRQTGVLEMDRPRLRAMQPGMAPAQTDQLLMQAVDRPSLRRKLGGRGRKGGRITSSPRSAAP